MVLLTKISGLKILVSSVLMLVIVNLVIYCSNFETAFSAKNVSKYAQNTVHSDEDEEIEKQLTLNNSVITEYDFIPKLNESFYNALPDYQRKELVNINLHEMSAQFKTAPKDKQMLIQCMDPRLDKGGPITPNVSLESLEVVEKELRPFLSPGGWYKPENCKVKHHVAIIVPFRDRYAHLSIFLKNIHPFLMKQNIEYRIFIIEQTNGKPFNRAALMNIGYLEALKLFFWDCFIFHDVDLLPLDDRNLYTCPRQPRHMSVAIDTFGFRLPYKTIFGGVSAMTRNHFLAVNGFSNSFFGWGGEDDDMSNRLKHANLYIARYPINVARYMMLSHQKERANPKRFENLVNGANKFELDGLNSIKYDIYSMKELPIFTWYLAELKMTDPICQS